MAHNYFLIFVAKISSFTNCNSFKKSNNIPDRAKDDYSANRRLRDALRSKRKVAKNIEISNAGKFLGISYQHGRNIKSVCTISQCLKILNIFSDVLSRASLQGSVVQLLPEDDADTKTATLLRYIVFK